MVSVLNSGLVGLVLFQTSYYQDRINSPVMPIIAAFFISYFIASLFMVVYETAMDTVFICFLVDAEYNKVNHRMDGMDGWDCGT